MVFHKSAIQLITRAPALPEGGDAAEDAVMITDTAFCRNSMYHTGSDTWDRLNYEQMAKVVIEVFEAVKSVGH